MKLPFVLRSKHEHRLASLNRELDNARAVINDLDESVQYYYGLYAEEKRNVDVQARKDELVAAALASEERAQRLVAEYRQRIANFLAPLEDDEDSDARS